MPLLERGGGGGEKTMSKIISMKFYSESLMIHQSSISDWLSVTSMQKLVVTTVFGQELWFLMVLAL